MDITTDRPSPDVAVLALDGELDGSNFEQVIEAGRAAHADGVRRVVLDLSGLTYMGSSGLVAIHSISLVMHGHQPTSPEDGWQALHELGSRDEDATEAVVLLAALPPTIERVLQRSVMIDLFPVHPDRASAVAAATSAASA